MALPAQLKNRLRLPVVGAPLFIVSNPDLVIAQCKAGIIGSFPALNARPADQLEVWLKRINEELDAWNQANPDTPAAPYAVNQIVHKSNARLQHDLEVCVKYKVPVVITSLGARPEVNQAVHSYGGIVLHDIINNTHARKAIEKGADGLIAVAAGAGGHAGTLSPFALIQEIRSALIATKEANADARYKQMIVDCGADDIVYSNLFTGVHGNYLKPSIINAGLNPDALEKGSAADMDFGAAASGEIGDVGKKAKAWKDIWGCGQGIGAVKQIESVETLVNRLTREYNGARERLAIN